MGNFCAAPVMLLEEGGYEKKLMYYYIGQFSRYVGRGSRKIATTQYTDALDVCAFLTQEKERVLIVLNRTEEDRHVVIREEQSGFEDTVPAHSIITYRIPGGE